MSRTLHECTPIGRRRCRAAPGSKENGGFPPFTKPSQTKWPPLWIRWTKFAIDSPDAVMRVGLLEVSIKEPSVWSKCACAVRRKPLDLQDQALGVTRVGGGFSNLPAWLYATSACSCMAFSRSSSTEGKLLTRRREQHKPGHASSEYGSYIGDTFSVRNPPF